MGWYTGGIGESLIAIGSHSSRHLDHAVGTRVGTFVPRSVKEPDLVAAYRREIGDSGFFGTIMPVPHLN